MIEGIWSLKTPYHLTIRRDAALNSTDRVRQSETLNFIPIEIINNNYKPAIESAL